MSFTNMFLGGNWKRSEWPDYIDVVHEADCRHTMRYVPESDLECELELTFAETVRTPVRVYECDCCGRSCDSVYAEDYVYCPYCGRLNTAREVEVDDEAV